MPLPRGPLRGSSTLPLQWGNVLRDIAIGLVAAVALGVINHALLTRAPSSWIVNGVRAVYHEVLVPVFGALHPIAIGVIGLAAGLGEEWLFRGLLQPTLGWVAASVLFGLAHMGGRAMLPFAAWAAIMGAALGGLAIVTGGLTAPMVAHGVYDIMALAYIGAPGYSEVGNVTTVQRVLVRKKRLVMRAAWTVAAALMMADGAFAQQRPLVTEDPETIGAGRILLELGCDGRARGRLSGERARPATGSWFRRSASVSA